MRTQDPRDPPVAQIVPDGPPFPHAPLPQSSGLRARVLSATALTVVIVLVAAFFFSITYHVPYIVESPGDATSVKPLIVVDPAHRHPVKGDVLLSTVGLIDSPPLFDLARAWIDPNMNIVSRRTLTQGASKTEFDKIAADEMVQSKQDSIVVALRRLGYGVPEHGEGALVAGVETHSPAAGVLSVGDVIVGAGGRSIALRSDLISAVRAHHPGESIQLDVTGAAGHRSPSVRLGACPAELCPGTNGSQAFMGVSSVTKSKRFDFPFKVDIDLNGVGGPSAGLAFAIGIIDTLTSGAITGGHRVAVTGTINLDGTVGPIGGIALKTVAVERSGADVFLVPADDNVPGAEPQYSAAKAKARGHHLQVIQVRTLEDALNALRSIGGDMTGLGAPPPKLTN